jgi:ribosome biogenesis GTPase
MKGLVVKATGSFYHVKLDNGKVIPCKMRGTLRLQGFEATSPLTVGDKVEIELQKGDDFGVIINIAERKNYIIRKSVKLSKQIQVIAANVDRAWVVATPVLPKTSLGFIDRFLATAEAYNIPGGIIFNKKDLYDEELLRYIYELEKMYKNIGYICIVISSFDKDDIKTLRLELKDKVNLFSGHSGVGKTTLINALIPGLELRTSPISVQFSKGRHTTTFAEMHELSGGGYIIDTPGIREFGTIDFDKYEVSHFFPEIFRTGRLCRFGNCFHTDEVECAVKDAVQKGDIAMSRYESYLSILGNEDIFR